MEPWFNPNLAGGVIGGVLGGLGGLCGTLVGTLAPRGKAKRLVYGVWMFALACCALLLIAGIAAKITGQPYGVWYVLGYSGLLGLVLFSCLFFLVVRRAYAAAEQRKMQARDV
jgi:MFS family permease